MTGKAGAAKRKLSVRFMAWAGARRWAWPLAYLVGNVWWPIWRFWAFHVRGHLDSAWWRIRKIIYRRFKLGCPKHHLPRLAEAHCPQCFTDRLLQNLKIAELRPPP